MIGVMGVDIGPTMLRSDLLHLRPIQERDLDALYRQLNTLEHRGSYFPMGLQAEPVFRRRFEETGFWSKDEGMLLMVNAQGQIVGEIEYFPVTDYLTGFELSYLIFGAEHHGKGYATEAVRLMSQYLFAQHRIERLQLNIHPENTASRRVAEKAGYSLEGVMRRAWFNGGRFHDLEIWSILRDEQQIP
ncbi:MAG: GNAT family protein [Nitriliruptorales bacterium]|nr:GNAT family protein [Nitriliruptorales bacterium]